LLGEICPPKIQNGIERPNSIQNFEAAPRRGMIKLKGNPAPASENLLFQRKDTRGKKRKEKERKERRRKMKV